VEPDRTGTGWLRGIRVVLALLLLGDILYLASVPFSHTVQSVGTVDTGVFWQGDPYVHRMHPELHPDQVVVGLSHVPGRNGTYSPLQTILWLLSDHLAFAIVTVPILVMAMRLAGAAIDHDPFTAPMVRRLRNLGLTILIAGALADVTAYVSAEILLRISVPKDALDFALPNTQLSFWWLVPAFTVLAVAQVMRRGVAMRAELDTVS
jgi:Protein of unknown function (DUF2975)